MLAHKVVSVPKVNCVCDSGRAARRTNSVSFQPSWLLGTNLAAPPARFYASTTKTLATCSSASGPDCRVGNLFVHTSSAKSSSLEL